MADLLVCVHHASGPFFDQTSLLIVSGANVVRFNNKSPDTKSDFYRICIDPKGVSNKANPHIPVSAGVIKTAERVQKVLKVRIHIN